MTGDRYNGPLARVQAQVRGRVLKLSNEQVDELLRKRSREHAGYKRLAAYYGVSRRYVQLICQGLRRSRRN